MSKISKITVFAVVFVFLFTVSMILSTFVFVPTVTLDLGYPRINWNYDGTDTTPVRNIKEYQSPVRFSHYEAPTPERSGYAFAGGIATLVVP